MRALKFGVFALALLAATATQSRADQIWDFSFTNVIPAGNTDGTVTGTIDLPLGVTGNTPDNGTAAATSVTITSSPAALGDISGEPTNAVTWNLQVANTFTVTGGVLAPIFVAEENSPPLPVLELSFNSNNASLYDVTTGAEVFDTSSPTYTFQPATPTPEPASILLLASGFAAGGLGLYRRRSAATA